MKKISKIAISILLLLAVSIVGYCVEGSNKQKQDTKNAQSTSCDIEQDGIKVAYDGESKSLLVTDQNGYVWNSVVGPEQYSWEDLNDTWKKKVQSIVHISYAEIDDTNPTIKNEFSFDADIKASEADGAIRLDCNFKKAGISFALLVGVEKEKMVVKIPAADIVESKDFRLLSIEVLPYFGACSNSEEGYLVYPDGSGALKHHDSIAPATMSNTSYIWDVYGNDLHSIDTLNTNEKKGLETAMLPVFGIKKGEHAFVAFSENGEEEAIINMYPSGSGIALNRMSFSFRYRTYYDIQMSNININGTNTAKNINGLMYNEELIAMDHDIHYGFLSNDKANYSGMATLYRETLLESGKLQKTELAENTGVSVDILMAASEQGFWSESVAVATTGEQAEAIMDAVNKVGFEDNSIFHLIGWSKGGYGVYPQSEKPDAKIISQSELKKMLASDNRITLQWEMLFAEEEGGGFSKSSDVIKTGNQHVITDSFESTYILNMDSINNRFHKLASGFKSVDQVNYSMESVGKVLFRDENEKNCMNRKEVREKLESILQEASKSGILSVQGANLYTLKYADMVYDLPVSSSQYFISDEDIPFCQMVLHGSVVYTGDYGNLSSDYEKQLLKWLEYGYIPAFKLTYSSSEVLKDTNCSELYTSRYESNMGRIQDAYKLYQDAISKIADAYITNHTVLSEGFVRVEYSNGYEVFLNYTKQDITYNDVVVKAGGYMMAGE